MAELDLSMNLYELNKQLMVQRTPIQDEMLRREFSGICDWFSYERDRYFMLLCNELKDYTIVHFKNRSKRTYEACHDLKDALDNRGEILDVEYENETNAYAIWIKINGEAFLYHLFPYDMGVIEV